MQARRAHATSLILYAERDLVGETQSASATSACLLLRSTHTALAHRSADKRVTGTLGYCSVGGVTRSIHSTCVWRGWVRDGAGVMNLQSRGRLIWRAIHPRSLARVFVVRLARSQCDHSSSHRGSLISVAREHRSQFGASATQARRS
jgi:hypothetical protein